MYLSYHTSSQIIIHLYWYDLIIAHKPSRWLLYCGYYPYQVSAISSLYTNNHSLKTTAAAWTYETSMACKDLEYVRDLQLQAANLAHTPNPYKPPQAARKIRNLSID